MNNKYKPKFYARTQTKLEYTKNREYTQEPDFFVVNNYRNLSEEQKLRVKKVFVTIIEQRLGESATKLLGDNMNIDDRIYQGTLQVLKNQGGQQ